MTTMHMTWIAHYLTDLQKKVAGTGWAMRDDLLDKVERMLDNVVRSRYGMAARVISVEYHDDPEAFRITCTPLALEWLTESLKGTNVVVWSDRPGSNYCIADLTFDGIPVTVE